jgi:peptidoglycan hydrolase CwlO-like protein
VRYNRLNRSNQHLIGENKQLSKDLQKQQGAIKTQRKRECGTLGFAAPELHTAITLRTQITKRQQEVNRAQQNLRNAQSTLKEAQRARDAARSAQQAAAQRRENSTSAYSAGRRTC